MLRRLLLCWLILGVLCAVCPCAVDPMRLGDVMERMRFPGVEVTVSWAECGEVNAYYDPRTHNVTMCYELLTAMQPDAIRFVLAHEIAHGVIQQRDIPYTGSQEVAADELAAVILSLYGDTEAVFASAEFWLTRGHPETPWDPHPGDTRRGITLACLAAESKSDYSLPLCTGWEWQHARHSWMKLLGIEP